MRTSLVAAIVTTVTTMALLATGPARAAGELDREKTVSAEQAQLASNLPKTLIMRVNPATKEVEVLHSGKKIAASETSKELVAKAKFTKVALNGKSKGELDRDSSSSSWYFYFPSYSYYYPTYYYYGYNYGYTPYYNYYYGGYNYYYYSYNYGYGY